MSFKYFSQHAGELKIGDPPGIFQGGGDLAGTLELHYQCGMLPKC